LTSLTQFSCSSDLLKAISSSSQARIEPFLKQQIRGDRYYASTAFTSMVELRSSTRFSSVDQSTAIKKLFLTPDSAQ